MLIVAEGDVEFDEGHFRFKGTHFILLGGRPSASIVLRTTGGLLDQERWRLFEYAGAPLAVTLSKTNLSQKSFRSLRPRETK